MSEALLPQFHLTAQPWQPSGLSRQDYLPVIDGLCRFLARNQNESGAIIDPLLEREHQYATPYFAFGVGTLLQAGRGLDLRDSGCLAMEHATRCFKGGSIRIPDRHGEFFLASLPAALPLYQSQVSEETFSLWRQRLRTSRREIVFGPDNNWRTYAMRGEWARAQLGLTSPEEALSFIEDA